MGRSTLQLEHNAAKFEAEAAKWDEEAAIAEKRAHAAQLLAVESVAVQAKALKEKATSTFERLAASDPPAFARMREVAESLNSTLGRPLQVGDVVTWISDTHGQCKAEVVEVPTSAGAAATVKVRREVTESVINFRFTVGFTAETEAAPRREVYNVPAPVQTLSNTATADGGVEYWRTLVATSTAALKGITAALQAACTRAARHGEHGEDAIRLITVPFKSVSSAARKRFRDYGGDIAKLVDFTRFSIICTTPEALANLLEHLHQDADLSFARLKFRLDERVASPDGYRCVGGHCECDWVGVRHCGRGASRKCASKCVLRWQKKRATPAHTLATNFCAHACVPNISAIAGFLRVCRVSTTSLHPRPRVLSYI
jgi:hypothetical protein